MMLFIDSSDPEQTTLGLFGKQEFWKSWPSRLSQSETLVLEIKKFCSQHKLRLPQIKKIAVVTGPGHFSRIRTGIATANALGYALAVPVVGIRKAAKYDLAKIGKIRGAKVATAFYGKKPNISKPKS